MYSIVSASRLFFSDFATPSTGVMSPTSDSAMSWIKAILVQCGTLMREEREAGASMVKMDILYMWSEIDSPWEIPNRLHPSRLVVLRRSRMWKNGTGDDVFFSGCTGNCDRTLRVLSVPVRGSTVLERERASGELIKALLACQRTSFGGPVGLLRCSMA